MAVDPAGADVALVADRLMRLMRTFNRLRSQFLAAAQHNVDWSAHVLITQLAVEGPMRSSALAELVQSDPSTVSRQVAALVKEGFVERRADPVDGRASLLVTTDKGQEIYRDHLALRNEHYRTLLAQWDSADLAIFARLLGTLTDNLEASKPAWLSAATSSTTPDQTPTEGSEEGNS